jgi:hypothetical protein
MEDQGWRHFGSGAGPNHAGSNQASPNHAGAENQPARGTLASPINSSGRNNVEKSAGSDGGGWRRFSDSSPAQHGSAGTMSRSPQESSTPGSSARGSSARGSSVPESKMQQRESGTDGGWRQFTPQSRGSMQESPGRSGESEGPRGGSQGSPRQDSPRGYSRPPLEMRQPIVTPRGSEGNGPMRGESPSRGPAGYGNSGGGHPQPSTGGGNRGGSGGGAPSHSPGSGHRR